MADQKEAKYFIEKMKDQNLDVLEILVGKLFGLKKRYEKKTHLHNKAYEHLCRFLKDQTVIHEDQLEVKDGKEISADALQNPSDKDATYRKKGYKSHKGYVVNITETAHPENSVQLITSASIAPNIKSVKELLLNNLSDLTLKTDIDELIVDGAYRIPETLKATQKNDVDLISTNMTGRKCNEPDRTTNGFVIEESVGIKLCPMGIVPIKYKYLENSDTYAAWLKKEDCLNCTHRANCLVKEQKKNIAIRFTGKRYMADQYRSLANTTHFKEKANLRAAIEGTIFVLKRVYGLGHLRVRSLEKVRYVVLLKIIGYNFKQFLKGLNRKKKGVAAQAIRFLQCCKPSFIYSYFKFFVAHVCSSDKSVAFG